MAYDSKSVERMERLVPEKAAKAVKAAYRDSLKAGHSVLYVSKGSLFSIDFSLEKKRIKDAPKRVKVEKSTPFKIG